MQDNRLNKIRLNRFIALCGICSRRKADEMISQGLVKVNQITINKLGFNVSWGDEVLVNGEKIQPENHQYVLLNKPKGYITTMSDEKNRKTVISLIKPSFKERLFPVGRLDKDTTGLLLFTNDGALAKELTHPKHEVRKTYNVSLNKSVSQRNMEAIKNGVKLEDGLMKTDHIRYLDNSQKTVQLTIHSGKNRIIRRLFRFFNYDVKKLDRVGYSFLKKDNLRQGKWRRLTLKEVTELKKNH